MARKKGLLPISANFEVGYAEPFDARSKVTTLAQLLDPESFGHMAYKGMLVAVTDDPTSSNNAVYRLKQLPHTTLDNWEVLAPGQTLWKSLEW